MLRLLLVTPDRDSLAGFASAVEGNDDVELIWSGSGEKALVMVADAPVDLVVTDETLGDMTGLEVAERLLSINPMINCAAVSQLSPEDFHEASEGLGLLAQLPPVPGEEQARALLEHLRTIKGNLAGMNTQ